jgi:hypothetical protein
VAAIRKLTQRHRVISAGDSEWDKVSQSPGRGPQSLTAYPRRAVLNVAMLLTTSELHLSNYKHLER